MRRGRKALSEFCTDYQCAGDCGKPGHGWQHEIPKALQQQADKIRALHPNNTPAHHFAAGFAAAGAFVANKQHKAATLAAFDELGRGDRTEAADQLRAVRRKAKDAL